MDVNAFRTSKPLDACAPDPVKALSGRVGAIILFGLPGVGKGTQARALSSVWGLPCISTGDLLRSHVERGTEVGCSVQEFIERGELVPDYFIQEMMEIRLHEADTARGFILDGFPRTLVQTVWMKNRLAVLHPDLPTYAFRIQVNRKTVRRRIAGRRHCPQCQATFNIYENRPKRNGICDHHPVPLIERPDDTLEILNRRFELYDVETAPVIEYFRSHGECVDVSGDGPIEWITESIVDSVNTLSASF